ncbi:MAG: flagellin [Pseudomonadota bacterium]
MPEIALTAPVRGNLLALQNTQQLADRSGTRLATGFKVASALDDAVAFFQAKSLGDRADDLTAKKNDVDQAASTLKAAVNATEAIDKILKQLKGVALSAKTATAQEKIDLTTTFNSLVTQLNLVLGDATYNGRNLVNTTTSLTVQFSDLTTSTLVIAGRDIQISGILFTLAAAAGQLSSLFCEAGGLVSAGAPVGFSGIDATNLTIVDWIVKELDEAVNTVRGAAKAIGGNVTLLQTRIDFTKQYTNILTEGSNKLRLADLNEEGANLVSLQTRQQLALQALSFAGQAEQSILGLFR